MKTTFKNGDEQITLEMAIQLQRNDKIVLDKWGVKKVKKISKVGNGAVVILGKVNGGQ